MKIEFLIFPISLITLLLMGCVQSDGSVRVLSDKASGKFFSDKPIEFTEEEIKARQNKLRNISHRSDVAENTDLTSVFEGEVVEKEYIDRLKAIKIKIAISTVVFGLKGGAVLLDVYTPLNKNGIQFEVGKKYRVSAVQMELEYWTWIWMGTYSI